MQVVDIRQDLIGRLVKLNKKNAVLISADSINIRLKNLKLEIQENLDKLKSSTKIFEILAYFLLTITGIFSFIKVLDLSSWPDLNKGALLILLTVTNAFTAFTQKLRIEKLEKQILLLEILEQIDSKE